MPYYNIHSHGTASDIDTVTFQSLYKDFEQVTGCPGRYYSIGLHPWYLQNAAGDLETVVMLADQKNVLAIGECGLDKVCDTDWQLQLSTFERQIELAKEVAKPLVIHCVRAYEELLQLLKKYKPAMPVVIHGYHKNMAIAERLLGGGAYLSFGAALLSRPGLSDVMAKIPGERLFLETDDATVAIKDIYKKAAEIRQTSEDALILQLGQNVKTVFRIS